MRAAALCHKSKCISCTIDMRVFTQLYMHASDSLHLYLTFSVVFRQRKKREHDQEEDPGKTTRLTLSLKKNVIPSVCTMLVDLSLFHLCICCVSLLLYLTLVHRHSTCCYLVIFENKLEERAKACCPPVLCDRYCWHRFNPVAQCTVL